MVSFLEKALMQHWRQADQTYNTETMLPISEIQDDSVILKDGWLRAIIKVEGLNLDLRNDDEIRVTLEQYKRFINSLSFPIQILVRNTYLDLTQYITHMQESLAHINDSPSLKAQGQSYINFMDRISAEQWLIFVKEFYVVVPYYSESDKNTMIKKPRREKLLSVLNAQEGIDKIVGRYRSFIKHKRRLDVRTNLVSEWLRSAGMQTERLEMKEIVWLLFSSYNPSLHVTQSEFVE